MIRVLVWNEYKHEQEKEKVAKIYPRGIHNAIADFLRCDDIEVRTATLYDENGEISDPTKFGRIVNIFIGETILYSYGFLFDYSSHKYLLNFNNVSFSSWLWFWVRHIRIT